MDLRKITADEINDFVRAESIGFSGHAEEPHLEYGRTVLEPDRTMAMFDGKTMVGTATSYPFQMTVEGRSLAAAGLSGITVLPTHRRQGILTRIMADQFETARAREEWLMPFWVSESHIYGRFGADVAARTEDWKIDRRHAQFRLPIETTGQVRLLEKEEAEKALPPIYQAISRQRNGGIGRSDKFFKTSFMDPEKWREGYSSWFYAVFENDGQAEGYVKYRLNVEKAENKILELFGVNEQASDALWRYCFGIDLMRSITIENRPVDDPLQWTLMEPRRLERKVSHDFWLRLVDIPKALAARSYASTGKIVIEVIDSFCPWNEGRISLEGGPDGATVITSKETADLICTANELAAIYLGGIAPSVLAHAGRIEEGRTGALAEADAMFRAARAPWPNQDF